MERADVVVIGAGLAGCSVAWHLAADHRVLVVDQAGQAGAEASAQNAGMVRRMGEDPYERALAIRTVERLVDLSDDWETEPSRVVGAVLALGRDPSHLHDAVAHLRARGVGVQACRLAEVAPAFVGGPIERGWFVPDERVADAHALVSGFVRGIRRTGTMRFGVAVTGIAVEAGAVVGIETEAGPVRADRVVLAAGAWSGALAADLGLHRPLFPLRRTLLQTAPHRLSTPDHPWCWVDDVGVYARPEAGGWLASGCDEAHDPPVPGPGSAGPIDPEHRALAQHKLETWLPALADVRFTGGWTGLRTFAPDRRPMLGEDPDITGLWWAAGLGGFGVTCSLAVGEAVAAWMRGQAVDWLHPAGVSPGRSMLTRWEIRPTGDLHDGRLIGGLG